jgi:hypothetical protein
MSVISLYKQHAIKKLAEKARKGELSSQELSELDNIVQSSVTVENLIGRGFLNPENANDPRQIKSATTKFLGSLYGNPMAQRYERLRDGAGDRVAYEDTPFQERRIISPEELAEGNYVLVPNISDQTVANRVVTKVGGIELDEPVSIGGGVDFTQVNADTPLGWASNKGAAQSQQRQFDYAYKESGGRTPVGVNTFLTPESNTFNDAYANAFMQIAGKIGIPDDVAKKFDDAVREGKYSVNQKGEKVYSIKPFPNWLGINHPQARDQLLGRNGFQNIGGNRQSVLFTAFQPEYKVLGMPSINEFHEVFKLPENFERGSAGYNMYLPEVGAEIQSFSNNTAYDSGIIGNPFGQIEGRVIPPEVFFPDIVEDYLARGKTMSDAIGAFMMNPKLMQIPTEQWAKEMRSYLDSNPGKAKEAVKALAGLGVSIPVIAAATGYSPESQASTVGQLNKAAKASELDLNPDRELYHWTGREDLQEFYPSSSGKFGPGVYLSPDKWYGEKYVRGGEPNRVSVYAPNKIANMDQVEQASTIAQERMKDMDFPGYAFSNVFWDETQKVLKDQGFEGLEYNKEVVVFDPSRLRSPDAEMSPEQRDSTNIFSARPETAVAAGAIGYGALQSDDVQAEQLEPFDPNKHQPRDVGLGGLSTEYTVTQDSPDGNVWVVPSIWWDQNGDPVVLKDEQQINQLAKQYEQSTGREFPRFPAGQYELADQWAQNRSAQGGASAVPLATEPFDPTQPSGIEVVGQYQGEQDVYNPVTPQQLLEQSKRELEQSVDWYEPSDPEDFDVSRYRTNTSPSQFGKNWFDVAGEMGRGVVTGSLGLLGDMESMGSGLLQGIISAAGDGTFGEGFAEGMTSYDTVFPTAEDMRGYVPSPPRLGNIPEEQMTAPLEFGEFLAPEPWSMLGPLGKAGKAL